MVINIPEIEPFTFQAGTAFSERVQLANKINEIIDGINSIGDIPELEGQIATLSSQIQAINGTIATIQNTMAQQGTTIQDIQGDISTLDEQMASVMSDITGLTSRIATAESTLTEHGNEINGLLGEVVDSVQMSSTAHGTVQVQINHEDGSNDISAPIDLGLIQTGGITLQTGASDRSFKLIITQTDGESWQTNDFIIPPGGGTEVTITSVTLEAGTTANTMKVSIGLSDGTPLDSNDYPVVTPAQYTALATRVSTVEGTTAQHTTQIGGLDSRVTALEDAEGYTLVPATASQLGGVKIGANITVQSDGTISIPVAGSALGLVKNGGNVVIDSTGNMNATIPDVSQFITESEADSKYQPKGNYLTTVPIGGTNIGGVKNGGNVTINADGTMNSAGGDPFPFLSNTVTLEFSTIPQNFNDLPIGAFFYMWFNLLSDTNDRYYVSFYGKKYDETKANVSGIILDISANSEIEMRCAYRLDCSNIDRIFVRSLSTSAGVYITSDNFVNGKMLY